MTYITEFKNIPGIGDLRNEQILFDYGGIPIIFVCRNSNGKGRYLCLCTDSVMTPEWLIAQVETQDLLRIVEDLMPVMEPYKGKNVFIANMDNSVMQYREIPYDEIDKGDLPDLEEKLENPNLEEYKRKLLTDMKIISFTSEYMVHRANEAKILKKSSNFKKNKSLKTTLKSNMLRVQFG